MKNSDNNNKKNAKPLGIWMATSLVLGNMIGSGVFLLPAVLAPFGGISIIGWLVTTVGALAFALVFSQLAQRYPATGGLYVYCKNEFGEAIGFLLAWGYWISICIGTAAISTAFTSYSSFFFPILNTNPLIGVTCTLLTMWSLTFINAYSIFGGGLMQLITTILKIIPILLVAFFGIFKLNLANFVPFNPSEFSNFSAICATSGLTLWAFLGLECASIPAGSITNPSRTIPLATTLGTIIAALIYILTTVSIMGLVPPAILAKSSAPFTDAASILWGPTGSIIIGIGAIIACLGAINGWILTQGQMAYAIAMDGFLPKALTRTSPHNAPYVSVIVSSSVSSILIFMSYSDSLVSMFEIMASLSAIMTLVTFMFCASARLLLLIKEKTSSSRANWLIISIAMIAFTYGILAIVSSKYEIVAWSLITILLGLPVYTWVKYKQF